MDAETTRYFRLIVTLDTGPFEVTKWEADFLESVLAQGTWVSQGQRDVLDDMAKKYEVSPDD